MSATLSIPGLDATAALQLIHGDCMEYMRDMPRRSVDHIITDIPYAEVSRPSGSARNFDKGIADKATFCSEDFAREASRLINGWILVFCGAEQSSALKKIFRTEGLLMVRSGVGIKTAPSPLNGQYGFLSATETFVVGKKPRARFYGHCVPPVFTMPPIHRTKRTHATEKPVSTMSQILSLLSAQDDLILDPCMGSGAVGVAAAQMGRRFIGIELDRGYFEAACKRLGAALPDGVGDDVVSDRDAAGQCSSFLSLPLLPVRCFRTRTFPAPRGHCDEQHLHAEPPRHPR